MGAGLRKLTGLETVEGGADLWRIMPVKAPPYRLTAAALDAVKAAHPGITDVDLEAVLKTNLKAPFPDLDIYTRIVDGRPKLLVAEKGERIESAWYLPGGEIVGEHGSHALPWTETDDGTLGDFDATSGNILANETTIVKGSTYSYKLYPAAWGAAYGQVTFDTTYADVWINSYVYFNNLDGAGTYSAVFRWTTGAVNVYFSVTSDGSAYFVNDWSSTDTGYDFSTGTWYWVSARCKWVTGVGHTFELWVDGVSKYGPTVKGTGAAAAPSIGRIGCSASASALTWYFDQCNMQITQKAEPVAAGGLAPLMFYREVPYLPGYDSQRNKWF